MLLFLLMFRGLSPCCIGIFSKPSFKLVKFLYVYIYLMVRSNDPVDEIIPAKSSAITLIPLELQAGHNLPDGVSTNRFLVRLY